MTERRRSGRLLAVGVLINTGFWGGLILGFFVGAAFAIARRAYKDYIVVKKSLPGMRKNAFKTAMTAAGWILVVAVVGFILLAGTDAREDDTTPASVPSPSAS